MSSSPLAGTQGIMRARPRRSVIPTSDDDDGDEREYVRSRSRSRGIDSADVSRDRRDASREATPSTTMPSDRSDAITSKAGPGLAPSPPVSFEDRVKKWSDAELALELKVREIKQYELMELLIQCLEGKSPPGQDVELVKMNRYVLWGLIGMCVC